MFALMRAMAAMKLYPRAFKLISSSNEWAGHDVYSGVRGLVSLFGTKPLTRSVCKRSSNRA